MDEDKEEKMGIQFERCSHLGDNLFGYKVIVIDNKSWLLCRSCYGNVMMQVLDELKRIEIRLK